MNIKVYDDFEQVVDIVMAIDKVSFDEQVEERWYTSRYSGNSKTFIYFDGSRPIAYTIIAGIDARFYDALREGVLDGDINVSPWMFMPLDMCDCVYLASIAVIPEFRKTGIAKELSRKSYDCVKDKRVIALVNDTGGKICSDMGLFLEWYDGRYNIAVHDPNPDVEVDVMWEASEATKKNLLYKFSDGDHGHTFEDVLLKIKENPQKRIEGDHQQYSRQELEMIKAWRIFCQGRKE